MANASSSLQGLSAESTRTTSSQHQSKPEASTRPPLRRLKALNPKDIPKDDGNDMMMTMSGPHPNDLNSFSVSWWARGEFVVRGNQSEGYQSSSEKPSDKGADDSASDSLQSLVDRVAMLDLNNRDSKVTDYFGHTKLHRGHHRATHVKKTHTKQATQSVKTSKITDFFPKRSNKWPLK